MEDSDLDIPPVHGFRERLRMPAVLSCYLLPEFWRGAQLARQTPEIVLTRVVAEDESRVGRRTLARQIVERSPYEPSPEERKRNDDMLIALGRLERGAGRRDLVSMSAYHAWLAQGTVPPPGLVATSDDE